MSVLRESVIVRTPGGDLKGELFVGADGLPTLEVTGGGYHENGCYTTATFPAAWTVCLVTIHPSDLLLYAWTRISDLRQEIIEAQREADAEERREPDCMDLGKAHLEAHGER